MILPHHGHTINLFCPRVAGGPITQPRPGGRSSIVALGSVALWHWEGARNLPQAPQFGFLSVSCVGIQFKLLATGNTDGISDLTMANQEVIGSVGQAPIHDFLRKTATSVCANSSLFVPRHASFPSFFYLS